jgi:hypothetical protein
MSDDERYVAFQVHSRLLSVHPQPDNRDLAKAAELASPEPNTAHADPRGDTVRAIQTPREAIAERANAAEAQGLLGDAINAALHWVSARSSMRQHLAEVAHVDLSPTDWTNCRNDGAQYWETALGSKPVPL